MLLKRRVNKIGSKGLSLTPFTSFFYNDLDNFSSSHTHSWNDISNKPTEYAPTNHNHNDIYYTESEINTTLSKYVTTTQIESIFNDRITYTTTDPDANVSTDYPDNTLICVYEEV